MRPRDSLFDVLPLVVGFEDGEGSRASEVVVGVSEVFTG